jgi:hypothetical protein
MDYKKTIFVVFLVFALFSLSRIRFWDNHVSSGDELEIHTSMINSYEEDMDDVRVVAYLPELGEVIRSPRFDIQDNDNYGKFMWWDVSENIPPGEYLVRIAASNDGNRARKFRHIIVE